MLDALAATDPVENQILFLLVGLGNNEANRLPYRFRRGVAEHALGARIPRNDDAVQILADDGIVG
jgi:hypothetical protein